MPADHGAVGGASDQPLKCPEPQTEEQAVVLAKIIRPVAKVPVVWELNQVWARWRFGAFQDHLLERWSSEYFSQADKEYIVTQYVAFLLSGEKK